MSDENVLTGQFEDVADTFSEEQDRLVQKMLDAMQFAYLCARGNALARMRGERVPSSYDSRGLHVYSYLWGEIHCLANEADVPAGALPTPAEMEREGQIDAAALYRKAVVEGEI